MNLFTNKLLITLGLVLLSTHGYANSLTAYEIMKRSDDRYVGDTFNQKLTMIFIDRHNKKRTRTLTRIGLNNEEVEKSVSTFLSPADVKNSAFLSYTWEDKTKEDVSWLYLPALKKVKRIPAGDKSDLFLGSDFTYSDIEGVEIDDYEYRIIENSVLVDGEECWVIERTPKKSVEDLVIRNTGYSKYQLWIRKKDYVPAKTKSWFKGNKVKYYKATDIKLIKNISTPQKMQMVTTQKGKAIHRTLLILTNTEYNIDIDESSLSISNLGE